MKKKSVFLAKKKKANSSKPLARKKDLLGDVKKLISQSRQNVATVVNAALTFLNWEIGNRIHREILKEKRAEYGLEIVSTLSRQLGGAILRR